MAPRKRHSSAALENGESDELPLENGDQPALDPPAATQPAKVLVDATQRVTQFFPFATFTLFQTLIANITNSAPCDTEMRTVIWIYFAIFCAATFALAVTARYSPSGSIGALLGDTKGTPHRREEKFEGTDREKLAKAALVIYRGLLACAAFAAFTLLQPPATTCLLSDWQVPPWLYNSLLGMIGALASVSSQFTGIVASGQLGCNDVI